LLDVSFIKYLAYKVAVPESKVIITSVIKGANVPAVIYSDSLLRFFEKGYLRFAFSSVGKSTLITSTPMISASAITAKANSGNNSIGSFF
jgi:hypothetical protein